MMPTANGVHTQVPPGMRPIFYLAFAGIPTGIAGNICPNCVYADGPAGLQGVASVLPHLPLGQK